MPSKYAADAVMMLMNSDNGCDDASDGGHGDEDSVVRYTWIKPRWYSHSCSE